MKKIILFTTMVLAVTVGTAYAYHTSGTWATDECGYVQNNGITVFCAVPNTYDAVPMTGGVMSRSYSYYEESSATGGLRTEERSMEPAHNGATVFCHGPATFDTLPMGGSVKSSSYFRSEESSAAGGLRSGEWGRELNNGITDFTGRSYDAYDAGAGSSGR